MIENCCFKHSYKNTYSNANIATFIEKPHIRDLIIANIDNGININVTGNIVDLSNITYYSLISNIEHFDGNLETFSNNSNVSYNIPLDSGYHDITNKFEKYYNGSEFLYLESGYTYYYYLLVIDEYNNRHTTTESLYLEPTEYDDRDTPIVNINNVTVYDTHFNIEFSIDDYSQFDYKVILSDSSSSQLYESISDTANIIYEENKTTGTYYANISYLEQTGVDIDFTDHLTNYYIHVLVKDHYRVPNYNSNISDALNIGIPPIVKSIAMTIERKDNNEINKTFNYNP